MCVTELNAAFCLPERGHNIFFFPTSHKKKPQLTFEKIVEKGHLKNMRTSEIAYRLITVSRRKSYAKTVAFSSPFSLTTPLLIQREAK